MSDLISRSKAIDIINEERCFAEELRRSTLDSEDRAHNMGQLGCAIGLARKIKELPAVDAVPVVHAKWTGGKYYNGTYGYEKTCTNCKKEYVVVYGYLFCPYCGARMEV